MEYLMFGHPATSIWTENWEQDVAFVHSQLAHQGLCEAKKGERMAGKGEKILGSKPVLQMVNEN